jgi:hypothetical protein
MAAACDGDECEPPPAAKDLAGRGQQTPGPLPEAQLPVALPLPTAGRAAALTTSPASPQPSTHAIARTQRSPTSRTRAGRNKHEDVGAAVARAGRTQPNETPPLNFKASKPSKYGNSRHEPSDSACPTLLRSAAFPGSVAPRGRQLQRLVGRCATSRTSKLRAGESSANASALRRGGDEAADGVQAPTRAHRPRDRGVPATTPTEGGGQRQASDRATSGHNPPRAPSPTCKADRGAEEMGTTSTTAAAEVSSTVALATARRPGAKRAPAPDGEAALAPRLRSRRLRQTHRRVSPRSEPAPNSRPPAHLRQRRPKPKPQPQHGAIQ